MPRKKLLVVSHACVTPANQLLFCALQQLAPDLDITLLIPSNWTNDYTGKPWSVMAHPDFKGRIVTLPVVFPWHISLHFYLHGLGRLLRTENPDWIYLDEEPWAVVTQQVARLNGGKAPFLFHTNQNLKKQYPFPFSKMEQWVYREAGHALPVGEEAAKVLREKGYQNPLTVFPYGIDETLYRPHPEEAAKLRTQWHTASNRFIFGYLGRFVEEKGLGGLIEAFHQVHQGYDHATLWLIGSGPLRETLIKQAASLGLEAPAFQVLPSVPHLEAPTMLSAMNVLMLPSLTRPFWKEQFGRVIIEALACEVPVLGSDSGEIPHLIRKLEGGRIFQEGNVQAMALVMRQMLASPEKAYEMGQKGRRNVLSGYTNAHLASQFYQILQQR